MTELVVGKKAPEFTLSTQSGTEVSLSSFMGKKAVVLYFYPKAMTPGCTKQACAIRDGITDYTQLDAVVYGVSADPQTKLQKFIEKENLNFDLLSDPDHKVCEKYDAWKPKKFMGKEFLGVVRKTYVVDKNGTIAAVIPKVDVKTHHQDVIEVLKSL